MYSRRLLAPYVGVVQIAEVGRAKAMSLDGENWIIRYALAGNPHMRSTQVSDDPRLNYLLVARIKQGRLETHAMHSLLDPDEVGQAIDQLYEAVSAASVPFGAADRYECWLLDCTDARPLALLQSSVDEEYMASPSPNPVWVAMPAAQLEVQAPEPPQNTYVPPVNYRLEKLVKERAGAKPRAAWFERSDPAADDFPPCLIREDWDTEERQRLCDLYIQRLAPRLLMMHGLSKSDRHRLEQAARHHVFDVERFYPLYPEVADTSVLNAARVEARMRRAAKA